MVQVLHAGATIPKFHNKATLPDAFSSSRREFKFVFEEEAPAGLAPLRDGINHAIPFIKNAKPRFIPMYCLSKPEHVAVQGELTSLQNKG